MPHVIDGFVIPLPKKNVDAYRRMAKKAGKIWMEYGALAYQECLAEDIQPPFGVPFSKLAKAKPDETVIFAWVVYKSRRQRDEITKKLMNDPRMNKMKEMPFDMKRMSMGVFSSLVSF